MGEISFYFWSDYVVVAFEMLDVESTCEANGVDWYLSPRDHARLVRHSSSSSVA